MGEAVEIFDGDYNGHRYLIFKPLINRTRNQIGD